MDVGALWVSLQREVGVSVAGSLVLLIVGKVAWVIGAAIRRFGQLHHPFSLSGPWGGTCRLPHYPPDVEAVEIYRLIVRGDHVDITFFNYRPDDAPILKYKGKAVLRGRLFSGYYYIPARDSSDSGVIALRLKGTALLGMYAQYDTKADDQLKISHPTTEDYGLHRIRLPLLAKIRLTFGWKPFATHDEARAVYDAARPATRNTAVASSPELTNA